MTTKRIIAREWIYFLGFTIPWLGLILLPVETSKQFDPNTAKLYEPRAVSQAEIDSLFANPPPSKMERSPSKSSFKVFEPKTWPHVGYSSDDIARTPSILFIPYFLCLFVRSVVWSIKMLKSKEKP